MNRTKLVELTNGVRRRIKLLAADLKGLKHSVQYTGDDEPKIIDLPEALANLTLAYRHLEDASMRLGKVMQAADGGVSVYDKDTTVGAPELEDIIAGALFDFAGALTTGETIEVGANQAPHALVDRLNEWFAKRGINSPNALVREWESHLPKKEVTGEVAT